MFKVVTLSEKTSDCFLLKFDDDGITSNILVDGGLKSDAKKSLNYFEIMKENNEIINYIILTHVDNDHVNGLLKLFENRIFDNSFVKAVIMNAPMQSTTVANINSNTEVGYHEGNKLVTILEGKKIPIYGASKGDFIEISNNTKVEFIAPSQDTINIYNSEWIADTEVCGYYDIDSTFEDLKHDIYIEDKSPKNRASISFIVSHQNKKALFTGDSVPSELIGNLIVDVDLFKIPHHGSCFNTNLELLHAYPSQRYIIPALSNTKPHKKTMSYFTELGWESEVYLPRGSWAFSVENELNSYDVNINPYVIGTEILI